MPFGDRRLDEPPWKWTSWRAGARERLPHPYLTLVACTIARDGTPRSALVLRRHPGSRPSRSRSTARVDFATHTIARRGHAHVSRTRAAAGSISTRATSRSSASRTRAGTPLRVRAAPAGAVPRRAARDRARRARRRRSRIRYRTSPDASALQWLAPAQTTGGVQPFLFSQCQAIHARSVVPLQDTPRLRVRYTRRARSCRATLTAVMAAADRGRDRATASSRIERFEMPQPIPPYLFAFAVGDLASRDLSPRCRVWAEPARRRARRRGSSPTSRR